MARGAPSPPAATCFCRKSARVMMPVKCAKWSPSPICKVECGNFPLRSGRCMTVWPWEAIRSTSSGFTSQDFSVFKMMSACVRAICAFRVLRLGKCMFSCANTARIDDLKASSNETESKCRTWHVVSVPCPVNLQSAMSRPSREVPDIKPKIIRVGCCAMR